MKAESRVVWALSWCWGGAVGLDGWLRILDCSVAVGASWLVCEWDRGICNGKPQSRAEQSRQCLCSGVQRLRDTHRPSTHPCLKQGQQEWTSLPFNWRQHCSFMQLQSSSLLSASLEKKEKRINLGIWATAPCSLSFEESSWRDCSSATA